MHKLATKRPEMIIDTDQDDQKIPEWLLDELIHRGYSLRMEGNWAKIGQNVKIFMLKDEYVIKKVGGIWEIRRGDDQKLVFFSSCPPSSPCLIP